MQGSYYTPGDSALDGVPSSVTDNQCSLLPILSVVYFFTFVLCCSYMLLQLVIGVIIDNINSSYNDENLAVGQVGWGPSGGTWLWARWGGGRGALAINSKKI